MLVLCFLLVEVVTVSGLTMVLVNWPVIEDGAVSGNVGGVGVSVEAFGVLLFMDLAMSSLVLRSFSVAGR